MAGLRRHRGASFIVLGPCVVLRWRRAANIGITVLVVIRLFVSYNLPGTLIMALPSGATIGAAVLYASGRPDRRPSAAGISKALINDGLALRQLSILDTDTPGSTRCVATSLNRPGRYIAQPSGSLHRSTVRVATSLLATTTRPAGSWPGCQRRPGSTSCRRSTGRGAGSRQRTCCCDR